MKTTGPETATNDAADARDAIDALSLDLRESEERYRTLFDLVPVAVYTIDGTGVIQNFNPRAAELWGRQPALGDTDERFCGSYRLFRPDGTFMPHPECPMALVVSGALSEVRDAEVIIERPDGSRVTVVVNIRPQKNQRGDVIGAINCFYDITERKASEEILRRSDRNKTEFLAMLAHELRNPLAPILVSIEILRRAHKIDEKQPERVDPTDAGSSAATRTDVNDRADHALRVLTRQVAHMVRLVDDLLDAGRISNGKIALRKERLDLSPVVLNAVDAVRPLCDNHQQQLTVTLPSEPLLLNADPARLAQIVGNLLNNACKFTARGGHIWLTVTRESSLAPQIVIRVRDTGVGIAADKLGDVFNMFAQLDTSLERSTAGLGIGLALVKTLTEKHGGTVDARSPGVGQGSEFIVRLPLLSETDRTIPRATSTDLTAIAPLRILIVDDNRDSADMIATLLTFGGHETHTANDGRAAVAAAANLQPDVIFMDLGLPILNGYEAARQIRERQTGKRPILVALTGWGQDEDRRRSESAGFDAHLVKPVDDRLLGKLLAELRPGTQSERN
jgi:signal transduction histidine kinase/CheY-like chemotaxis protein